MGLVHWQYSGAHHNVVKGIGLESLIWTNDVDYHIPIDFRIYDKDTDGKTKNEHFRDMISLAKYRGFNPKYILFDGWRASLDNLKMLDKLDYKWITQLPKTGWFQQNRKNISIWMNLHFPKKELWFILRDTALLKYSRKSLKKEALNIMPPTTLTFQCLT